MRISDWSSDVCSSDLRVNSACIPLEFMALKYESLTLGKTRLRLCPVDGAIVTAGPRGFSLRAAVRAPNLKGKLGQNRSEEHTSELQSLMRISYAVFCLKKKNNLHKQHTST